MSYIAAAKKDGRPSWFVFRGQTDDGTTVTRVAWATRALAEAGTGMIEPRLLLDGGISRSMPQDVGGTPASCAVTIGLISTDDALRDLIIGTSSVDPSQEYSGGSLLNLSGKLYHAVQDEDGTIYDSAITPTLYVTGSPTYDGHVIHLPMSSNTDKALGRSKMAWTLEQITNSEPGTDGIDPAHGSEIDPVYVDSDGSSGALLQSDVSSALRDWKEGLDTRARFIYGGSQGVRLTRVRALRAFVGDNSAGFEIAKKVSFFAFLAVLEPYTENFARWSISLGSADGAEEPISIGGRRIVKAARWMQDQDDAWRLVWVVYVLQSYRDDKNVPSQQLYQDQELWLSGMPDFIGLAGASPPPPKSAYNSAAYVVRRLVTDHSELGSGAIDTASFEIARKALPFSGLCAGMYAGDTPLRDIATHIAGPFGLLLWEGNDGKLRAQLAGQFSREELDAVDAGGLDELTEADILGDWQEIIPRTAEERGAAISRVTTEWTDEQIRFWGNDYLTQSYRSSARIPLGQVVEARLSMAWVNPARGFAVLARYAGALAYPARRIRFRTRLWVASREFGTLMLLTHRRGLASGGYVRRLIRLEGVEVSPDLRNLVATFEDLGPVAGLKFALLDDYANWIKTTPAGGTTLTLSAGSTTAVASANTFAAGDVGATLCLRGSTIAGNRRNRKIVAFTDARHVTMDFAAASDEVITMAGAGIDATWLVVYNHGLPPGGGRQLRYIQEGKESNAKFTDASDCFRYEVG